MSTEKRFGSNLTSYQDSGEFLEKAKQEFKVTEIVLDIGCGIYPINFFVPKLHILVEPWSEYVEILRERYKKDSRILIFQASAIEVLKTLSDKSVDSVYLLDVIEHLEKDEGKRLLFELERVTLQQIVIFTPLGYMPQHVEVDKRDRWGLSGGDYQEHKSGWLPEDFEGDWKFHVCPEFHKYDDDGKEFIPAFGAFYAIRDLNSSELHVQRTYSGDFFRPTAKDQELNTVTQELNTVTNSYSWRITAFLRMIKAFLGKVIGKFRIKYKDARKVFN